MSVHVLFDEVQVEDGREDDWSRFDHVAFPGL